MLRPDGPPSPTPLPYVRSSRPPSSPSATDRLHISSPATQQPSSRKSVRPSTAPEATANREDLNWLPATQPSSDYLSARLSDPKKLSRKDVVHPMQTVVEDDSDMQGSTNLDAHPTLPSSPVQSDLLTTTGGAGERTSLSGLADYDWATFMAAYAAGRWDPNKTPNPPHPTEQRLPEVCHIPTYNNLRSKTSETSARNTSNSLKPTPQIITETPTDDSVPSVSGLPITSSGPTRSLSSLPLRLRLPAHRFRNSFSSTSNPVVNHLPTSSSDVQATVATMRWAAACVDISPLALPSPEHELTDPMRGVMATVPGSHPLESNFFMDFTPGEIRKSRLNGFWEGTTDVSDSRENQIAGNRSSMSVTDVKDDPAEPLVTTDNTESDQVQTEASTKPATNDSRPHFSALPASAPLPNTRGNSVIATDYFGDLANVVAAENDSHGSSLSDSVVRPPRGSSMYALLREGGTMPAITSTSTAPALSKRLSLTRQTSSPLPDSVSQVPAYLRARAPSDTLASIRLGRAIKEEHMFAELGYLAPPFPPDELERRRALYKFNIWNTKPDGNFDRIAHLAKLVFNTKGVMISLIDGHELWYKSEWGIKTPSRLRTQSFCGHAILQRGDEPMVILDTTKDWRFEKNPLSIGAPFIQFYAGAPLRTQDGYNIGTLAVVDDQSREEFSPRQRHTLREFAAITMREMELWRDKIQLRIRDRIQTSMEKFSRECLEMEAEMDQLKRDVIGGSDMDRVYDSAAKLVKVTLEIEEVIVMDVSHCEVLESSSAEGSVSVKMHHGDDGIKMTDRRLSEEEYRNITSFFDKYPEGKISEGIIPHCFKPFMPTRIQYALTVPIFNIDKRPFALLCAYNTYEHPTRYLEGHELSYMRAIGVIILSAVLKRRMLLADQAKGLFISNISHELRTPLHGILAAAELLGATTKLDPTQSSFLQTVQACGTSLVETVNHVLDFTKLSGNTKAGGVENVIAPTTVDLLKLVEDAIDGCWIGHRARTAANADDSGIGSVYSPPKDDQGTSQRKHVETIVDIGYRGEGWVLKLEQGGIRRVLMNLFGNSLKFTSEGYIHIILRQLPHHAEDPPNKVRVQLGVFDTGKGISKKFVEEHLFHPFAQENPLQTGTGLGLAIVNSIVKSENVDGNLDVWSQEGVGTEIKVTFLADAPELINKFQPTGTVEPFRMDDPSEPLPTVSLVGFSSSVKEAQLLREVISTYLRDWWGFTIVENGDIIVINEEEEIIVEATKRRDTTHSFILLSAARGNPDIMDIVREHESIGGFCRIMYKPGGPSRLRPLLSWGIHASHIAKSSQSQTQPQPGSPDGEAHPMHGSLRNKASMLAGSTVFRRNSDEQRVGEGLMRPRMPPRALTVHPLATQQLPTASTTPEPPDVPDPEAPAPTVTLGSVGTLLKSSVGSLEPVNNFRVLVIEDNSILRNLLLKWLSTKDYQFSSAVNGREGVDVFREEGPFDVILLDLSMPVLDGVGATIEIRKIEAELKDRLPERRKSQILALTGMSSLEDKRRAFEAGVDGYLVKPVAFRTLDEMFHKLGLSQQ